MKNYKSTSVWVKLRSLCSLFVNKLECPHSFRLSQWYIYLIIGFLKVYLSCFLEFLYCFGASQTIFELVQVVMLIMLWICTRKNNFMTILYLWCNLSTSLWVLDFQLLRNSECFYHIILCFGCHEFAFYPYASLFHWADGKICWVQLGGIILLSSSTATTATCSCSQ